ncbi:hypothetical protein DFH06DRAFT_527229 [Mycena polygramma]|nr:hypothetical protein DFH06DRAFT_527229 [Mycena polygramma]
MRRKMRDQTHTQTIIVQKISAESTLWMPIPARRAASDPFLSPFPSLSTQTPTMDQASRLHPRDEDASMNPGSPAQRRRLDAPGSIVKDEKYFRSDGDCVIQVESTLFKIHRYHLMDRSSVFQDMFPPNRPLEGTDESNPIVFKDETASQIRAFLFYSYSDATQLQVSRASVADMGRVLDLLTFAHKYLMRECLLWALESLEHILDSAATIPESQYLIIFQTTNICTSLHPLTCGRILELLTGQWIENIKADPLRSIVPAIDLAESLGFKAFLVALYGVVLETIDVPNELGQALVDGPLSSLSTTHLLRIFSGQWFLTRSSEHFRTVAPDIHLSTCPPGSSCRVNFSHYWTSYVARGVDEDNPVSITKVITDSKEYIVNAMTSVGATCPIDTGIDSAVAAFNAAIVDNYFKLQ